MKKAFLAIAILVSHTSMAGQQTGKVLDIRVSSNSIGGNPTHIALDGIWQSKPACATGGFWAINTDTSVGKNMLATLLAAQATGRPVMIWGTNQCDLRFDMETAYQVGLPQ